MIRREYTDPTFLAHQYSDSERLRTRIAFHERHSEEANDWHRFLLAQVDARPGERLLDAGCGDGGEYHPPLLARGVRLVGLDRSPGMATRAARHGGSVVQGDIAGLPFADAAFDAVMCNHALYHVPDQRAGLLELRRVCRPGGRVAVAANSRQTMPELWALVQEAAAQAGVAERSPGDLGTPFAIEDGQRVRDVLPGAELRQRISWLRVSEPAWIVRYVATSREDPELLRALGDLAEAEVARRGAIRIQRIAGVFLARR